jgi:hypothetical protein
MESKQFIHRKDVQQIREMMVKMTDAKDLNSVQANGSRSSRGTRCKGFHCGDHSEVVVWFR